MRTNLIMTKIDALKKEIEELKKGLQYIYLHPSMSHNKMRRIKIKLELNGWVVTSHMTAYEGWFGYGTDLAKSKEELTEWDKKFLAKIGEYSTIY